MRTRQAPGFKRRRSEWTGVAFAWSAILAIAACNGQTQEKDDVSTVAPSDSERAEEPLRSLNPAPRRAFEIRVVLEEVPGPLVSVDAVAQYDVENAPECGKPVPLAGAFPRISSNEPVSLEKVSDTEYAGTVYVDRILDEDYFGRGVCRWTLAEARVGLQGADDDYATRFVATLPGESLVSGGTKSTYFWKGYFPRETMTHYSTFGDPSLDHVPAESRHEFFTVTLSARESAP